MAQIAERWFNKTLLYLVAILFLLIFGSPLVWMIYTTFKTMPEITRSVWALPSSLNPKNYEIVLSRSNLPRYYVNSIVVSTISVGALTLLSAMAGFVFARIPFRGSNAMFILFLAGMMIPIHITLIPVYIMLRDLGLLSTLWALIFPYVGFGLPLSIFILRSFFAELPVELEDAARIDGCSTAGIFWRIMLPLARPAIVTVIIVNLVNTWNEYLFALTFIHKGEYRTLPLGLAEFEGAQGALNIDLVFTALTLAALPVLVVYFLAQRQILSGLTAGALKG
jgi:raffinose/stachyose/melibiose transport system permease protein